MGKINMKHSDAAEALLDAAALRLESQQATAIADLSVYLTFPVGIGEHADITEEVIQKVKDIAEATDALETLVKLKAEFYDTDTET
jgi:hypothetical protein